MKQIFALFLTLSLLLSLTACGNTEVPEGETTTPTVVLQDQLEQTVQVVHYDWADDLPRMDGSTSTIPLEAGIRAALFGISQAEAELQVSHSTTYGSFYNLIDGACDLIFSVPLSEGQIAQAREKGMELTMTKIAAEGFVFVVNAQNPVDALTQQQLKDIYSGKITNWSEVGGNDAPIVAYQRNETSGSQNFMHEFMGDTELMDPLTSALSVPSGMGELMDAVAVYDNSANAIGYSVYAYAADMYGNGNEIKFIHVDGVEPTKTTMADGSYPLLSYNYAVYDAATPENASLRKLVDWLISDEGQRAIQAAGYIPLRPVGEIAETVIRLYSAVGTGPEKPEGYTPSLDCYTVAGDWISNDQIAHLTNTALQDEINTFIDETVDELCGKDGSLWSSIDVECINGYLSIGVCIYNDYYLRDIRTAIYDLVAGERIAFSDLFFKGEKYVPVLNDVLADEISAQQWVYDENVTEGRLVDSYPTKRPFVGLVAGHDTFTLSRVAFPANNLYFDSSLTLYFYGLYSQMVLSQARDMTGLFDDSMKIMHGFATDNAFTTDNMLIKERYDVQLLNEAYYDAAVCEKVNSRIRELCETEWSDDALGAWYGGTVDGMEVCFLGMQVLGERWFLLSGSMWIHGDGGLKSVTEHKVYRLFDCTTGEEIPYTVLLKDGWLEQAEWYCAADKDEFLWMPEAEKESIESPDMDELTFCSMEALSNGYMAVEFRRQTRDNEVVWAEVPGEYINWGV